MSVREFFGWLLTVVGGLLALFAGGCSLFFLFQEAGDEFLPFVLVIGGVPLLVGWGVFSWGRSLLSKDKENS